MDFGIEEGRACLGLDGRVQCKLGACPPVGLTFAQNLMLCVFNLDDKVVLESHCFLE